MANNYNANFSLKSNDSSSNLLLGLWQSSIMLNGEIGKKLQLKCA
jgi:hypothetical protein